MDRITTLQSFVDKSPDQAFPRYGLAMEYKNQGRLTEALVVFAELVDRCPDYVATYLMYGNTLAETGEAGKAVKTYRRGIQVARDAKDSHTVGEIETALAEITSAT